MLRCRPPPPVGAGPISVCGVRPRGPRTSNALGRQTDRGQIENMLDSFWEVRSLSPDRALRLRTYGYNPYPYYTVRMQARGVFDPAQRLRLVEAAASIPQLGKALGTCRLPHDSCITGSPAPPHDSRKPTCLLHYGNLRRCMAGVSASAGAPHCIECTPAWDASIISSCHLHELQPGSPPSQLHFTYSLPPLVRAPVPWMPPSPFRSHPPPSLLLQALAGPGRL